MNPIARVVPLYLALACGPLIAADSPPPAGDPSVLTARVVAYGDKDVVPVKAKVRYTTLIVLPKQESILDYTCGDKEFWIVNGTANFVYIKPAKTNSETNLNLITASGNVYSFVLREISDSQAGEPDLKVFIEPKETSMLAAIDGKPRFLTATQVDDYRQQAEIAREQARSARAESQATIERELSRMPSEYASKVQYVYRFPTGDKVFRVSAIYHDGKFTYIRASPQETPALYELKDGKPNLVNFDFKDGIYVVAKVLDSGYLAIGKQKLNFERTE